MNNTLRILISLLILSLAIYIKISDFRIVKQMQLKVFDTFQQKYPRQYTDQPIKIVDIDDESLEELGQWPWPRSIMADLVDRLNEAGVAAIAMDIVFSEEDRTSPKHILSLWKKEDKLSYLLDELPDHDTLFADSISGANVVTGFVLNNDISGKFAQSKAGYSYAGNDPSPFLSRFRGYITSLKILEDAANGNGALNSIVDDDGIIRRIPLVLITASTFVPSLSAEALRIAQGASTYIIKTAGASGETSFGTNSGITSVKIGHLEIPTDRTAKLWVYYTQYTQERYIPAWKVLDPDYDLSHLEGNIIFIGTSSEGLRDIRATPLNPAANGVEVHVQALEQMLTGDFLNRPDWVHGAEIAMMVAVGLTLIIMMSKLSALWGALFTLLSLGGSLAFSWYSFLEYKTLIDPVIPGIAISLIYLSESLIRYISSETEKKQVRNAFSHYMSPALVEQLAKNPDSLKLGGETKELTILFCDIRGFTTISEQFDAHSLTHFINRFLTPMTTIILDKKGTIDKYMGDCIMAFWNAPLDDENHAQNACLSALKMLDALVELNSRQEKEAKEAGRKFIPINIGIGLNTGNCCVGNMGSEQRFDYSVLGDDVNLASRLEGQSKTYGVNIVIGENTKKKIDDMATLELDLIQVKGKTEPVRIFTLLGDKELKISDNFKLLSDDFNKMLHEYRSQNLKKSKSLLRSCKTHAAKITAINIEGLFELYEERIKEFEKNPPPKDWDGVFIATSK
ncbi:MAG: adenylate/guanylate cyclase domain-containing protein [Rickettsiales bacterium]|nr:adenylate/guanylate cyclase domain-containing protein [Pseudomonadota bacterium]MDA0966125.1 adenylate/guanylate cyclase domain-containing protein [Pseudomonadota bacterium]MDG4543210.1 adenylate/guanylate cyclase domain-containing protein [Rickettsiales bacterium]MDG4545408.1 adenylate/guanylate cyclase domain-containing protein [Rickettsiales bacterium]MDG4547857.1 adenylate/guanylate cyclase domain-containing protein [Rickettsiales bacterium]